MTPGTTNVFHVCYVFILRGEQLEGDCLITVRHCTDKNVLQQIKQGIAEMLLPKKVSPDTMVIRSLSRLD